ncbi:MAG TPA: YggT family protein [Terriglobales bacterium]|nr:YggT family protein [Terriglobales bacterium]
MSSIFTILYYALWIFELVLLARVILSWFPNVDRSNPLIQFLYTVTEPVLRPIREMMPPTGMMDLSPLIVFLIIQVIMTLIQRF